MRLDGLHRALADLAPAAVHAAHEGLGGEGDEAAAGLTALAAQILALSDGALAKRLTDERTANTAEVLAKNAAVRKKFGK